MDVGSASRSGSDLDCDAFAVPCRSRRNRSGYRAGACSVDADRVMERRSGRLSSRRERTAFLSLAGYGNEGRALSYEQSLLAVPFHCFLHTSGHLARYCSIRGWTAG